MTWHRAKVAAGSDGDDVSDFDEVQQGSDPTDASDHGIVQGDTVDLTLQLSGGYACTHLGPVQLEVGRIRHRQKHANASYTGTYRLRLGTALPVQMTWLPGANTWNDWCQSSLTVNNQAFAPTAMDGRYVAGNAILDDPSGVFACGYGVCPWYDPPPTATLSLPQLCINDFSGKTLPEGICVPSNSMVILNENH